MVGMRLPDWSPKAPAKKTTNTFNSMAKRLGPTQAPPKAIAKPAPKKPAMTSAQLAQANRAFSQPIPKPKPAPKPASGSSTLGRTSSGSYSGLASGGGGWGGGGGGGGAVSVATALPAEPPAPKAPSIDDWLKTDSIFNTEQAQLESAIKRMRAEYGGFSDGTKGDWSGGRLQNMYDTDFNKNLGDLGWDEEGGQWMRDNRLSSYGSAFGNQLEDYAGRGMLDSSAYLQALGDLNQGFDDQLGSMRTGRENYISDLQSQWSDGYSTNQEALARARQDSIMRRAAEFNLPFNKA